jgi:hypothetical protein
MDALHARVSALVEDAVDSKQDPVVTFARIRDLAWSLEGETPSSVPRRPVAADRARAPRLTEAWFC